MPGWEALEGMESGKGFKTRFLTLHFKSSKLRLYNVDEKYIMIKYASKCFCFLQNFTIN